MNILFVDRISLFHQIVANALEENGVDCVYSNSATDALNKLCDGAFDVICLSLYLDDMNALELCKQIRRSQENAHTPVILITSSEQSEVYKKALMAGITDVFDKEDLDQLVNFLKRISRHTNKISGRILYVEDSLSQRLLITEMFIRHGLEVDGFDSGEKGWEAYQAGSYDLVVTDIVLEGRMSGVSLANRIRRMNGDKGEVPILAVTAFDNISRRIGLFYLGIDDYVIKPVVEEELFTRAKLLIERHKLIETAKRNSN